MLQKVVEGEKREARSEKRGATSEPGERNRLTGCEPSAGTNRRKERVAWTRWMFVSEQGAVHARTELGACGLFANFPNKICVLRGIPGARATSDWKQLCADSSTGVVFAGQECPFAKRVRRHDSQVLAMSIGGSGSAGVRPNTTP